eukprot:maker-scaffold_14-snap-gene-0.2-mRNA-1 protein AED:0.03 eAED:0.03 QI:434/1/1/1/1/1/2/206/400
MSEVEEESLAPTDLSDSSVVDKYKVAADIANKALNGLIRYCKPGQKVVSACQLGDTLINKQCESVFKNKEIEKGVAFPTCISLNNILCHYSPLASESIDFKQGDLVKIDLGVHIDGFPAVVAHSFILEGEKGEEKDEEEQEVVEGRVADLFVAGYTAFEAACRMVKPGTKNSEVTKMINKIAEKFGVSTVQGVLMHQMKQFVIDGNDVIIQKEDSDNKVDEFEFEVNQVYTIDIALSTGEGKPTQREERTCVFKRALETSYIMKLKSSKIVFGQISKNFSTFPFTLRQVNPKDERQSKMGIVECVRHQLVHSYPVLSEKEGEKTIHFKCTLLVMPSQTLKITGVELTGSQYLVGLKEKFKSGKQTEVDSDESIQEVLKRSMKKKKKKKKKKVAATAESAE